MSRDAAPTTVHLLRHGRVVDAWRARVYGGLDVPLSPEGERQARTAARRLADVHLDAVVSSGLGRAEFGAALLRAPRGLARRDAPELVELDRGEWAGLTFEELERRDPGGWERWMSDPAGRRPPGGESLEDLAARVLPVLDALAAEHPAGAVAIVAHSWVARIVACAALGLAPGRATSLHLAVGDWLAVDWPQAWHARGAGSHPWPVLAGYALDRAPARGVRWYRGPRPPTSTDR